MRSVLLRAGPVWAGFGCCSGNESFCRAQAVPAVSPRASDPSGAQGASSSLQEWHPGLVLLYRPGWGSQGAALVQDAGPEPAAARSMGVSSLQQRSPFSWFAVFLYSALHKSIQRPQSNLQPHPGTAITGLGGESKWICRGWMGGLGCCLGGRSSPQPLLLAAVAPSPCTLWGSQSLSTSRSRWTPQTGRTNQSGTR